MIEWINKVLVISRHLLIIFTFKTIFLTISKPSLNKKASDPNAFISYKDILQAPFEVKNRARTFRIIALRKKNSNIFSKDRSLSTRFKIKRRGPYKCL